MMNTRELKVQELTEKETLNCKGGHWAIAAAYATFSLFYQFGKDSYEIHPESFV